MDRSRNIREIGELYRAVLCLQNEDECDRFFEDLFTVSELQSIAQRMEVARMLDGDTTYQEICAKTGASTATISRVNRCLLYGANGYRTVLDRLYDKNK